MKFVKCKWIKFIIYQLPPYLQTLLMRLKAVGRSAKIGKKSYIHKSVQILGQASVMIGENTVISQETWLNVNHRNDKNCAIKIGDHCFIGRRNFLSSGARIEIGDYVLTANDCHFLGSSHVIDNPLRPYVMTGTTSTDTIIIGTNSFFGAGARVLGNVTIGHGCIVGACSLVTNNVPPFSIVTGCPAKIQRRYSFLRNCWVSAAEFTLEDEQALLDQSAYLDHLKEHATPHMPYIAAGSDMGNC